MHFPFQGLFIRVCPNLYNSLCSAGIGGGGGIIICFTFTRCHITFLSRLFPLFAHFWVWPKVAIQFQIADVRHHTDSALTGKYVPSIGGHKTKSLLPGIIKLLSRLKHAVIQCVQNILKERVADSCVLKFSPSKVPLCLLVNQGVHKHKPMRSLSCCDL